MADMTDAALLHWIADTFSGPNEGFALSAKGIAQLRAIAARLQPTQQPPPEPGWRTIEVFEFDNLMTALDRADRKGYMPDAMVDWWNAFQYREVTNRPVEGETNAQWIPVSERLPEPNTRLLYYFEVVGVHVGEMEPGATCQANAVFHGRSGFLSGDVTHWMPLPSAPNQPQGDADV